MHAVIPSTEILPGTHDVHTWLSPIPFVFLPGTQSVQTDTPAAANFPDTQLVQIAAPTPANLPGTHDAHVSLSPIPFVFVPPAHSAQAVAPTAANFPDTQLVQIAAPTPANLPGIHDAHVPLSPAPLVFVPAAQFVQVVAPVPENFPGAQPLQFLVPAAENLPGMQLQFVSCVLETDEVVFTGQAVHALEPTTPLYVPVAHPRHVENRVMDMYPIGLNSANET
jgi:hypothetical protein